MQDFAIHSVTKLLSSKLWFNPSDHSRRFSPLPPKIFGWDCKRIPPRGPSYDPDHCADVVTIFGCAFPLPNSFPCPTLVQVYSMNFELVGRMAPMQLTVSPQLLSPLADFAHSSKVRYPACITSAPPPHTYFALCDFVVGITCALGSNSLVLPCSRHVPPPPLYW